MSDRDSTGRGATAGHEKVLPTQRTNQPPHTQSQKCPGRGTGRMGCGGQGTTAVAQGSTWDTSRVVSAVRLAKVLAGRAVSWLLYRYSSCNAVSSRSAPGCVRCDSQAHGGSRHGGINTTAGGTSVCGGGGGTECRAQKCSETQGTLSRQSARAKPTEGAAAAQQAAARFSSHCSTQQHATASHKAAQHLPAGTVAN